MSRISPTLVMFSLLTLAPACSQETPSSLKEVWNEANDPEIFSLKTARFTDLPLEGSLPDERFPWSDYYWATRRGGISYRWQGGEAFMSSYKEYQYEWLKVDDLKNHDTPEVKDLVAKLSPAEKYDLYLNNYEFPLAKHERERQGQAVSPETGDIPSWFGLCHGWAPATIMEPEAGSVVLKNESGLEIPFFSSDIKALVTKVYASYPAKVRFLGERCNTPDNSIAFDENGRITDTKCRDTNPATLHLILAKYLGSEKLEERRGFIMDMTYSAEVWNQPVVAFKVISHEETDFDPAADKNAAHRAPGTKSLVQIAAQLSYIGETSPSKEPSQDSKAEYTQTMDLRYTLELDAAGTIIGGEWISTDRPDFVWSLEAAPDSGDNYLSYKIVREILDASRATAGAETRQP